MMSLQIADVNAVPTFDRGVPRAPAVPPRHVFTVDVEEWFQVSALEPYIPRTSWDARTSRVEAATGRLLDLLARYGSTGTFFVLGWVAERQPGLVQRIADAGHEVASHGWWHERVTTITPERFRLDVRRARALLRELSGQEVRGYRAPSFSIVPGLEWAFDILLEEGYAYDSSIFPIRRSAGYGYAAAADTPHLISRNAGTLTELPLTPLRAGNRRIPACGGAYFRHLPYALAAQTFRQRERRGESGVFYIHPWELDVDQPRVAASRVTALRHYGGVTRTEPRLHRLLSEFTFTTAASVLGIETRAVVPAAGMTS